jgi:invasion protein IalB
MTFGQAIEAMKKGKKLLVSGWNGKGMYLYYVPANRLPTDHGGWSRACRPAMMASSTMPPTSPCSLQNEVVPWLASQTDMLAEDWSIVD